MKERHQFQSYSSVDADSAAVVVAEGDDDVVVDYPHSQHRQHRDRHQSWRVMAINLQLLIWALIGALILLSCY